MSLIEREYQLKVVINGKPSLKTWVGKDGLDACKRYQDYFKDHTVIAWRELPYGVYEGIDARQIIG